LMNQTAGGSTQSTVGMFHYCYVKLVVNCSWLFVLWSKIRVCTFYNNSVKT